MLGSQTLGNIGNAVGISLLWVYSLPPLEAVGVGRRAEMSLTGLHPLWDKILSQKLQAVPDQGCHLEGSPLIRGLLVGGYTGGSNDDCPARWIFPWMIAAREEVRFRKSL
jgi:hypothetical protein